MLGQYIVGVDVAKAWLDVAWIDGRTLRVDRTPEAIAGLLERLLAQPPTQVVMEATGGLETELAIALAAADLAVAVVNPRQVRDYAKACGRLARTDRIDALALATFARAIRPQVRALPDEHTRALGDVLARRRQLVEMRVQENVRCGGLHRIERLMLAQALRARPRRRGLTKDCRERSAIADNVLDRQFQAEAPNQKWVADFTYVLTAEGWLYVAVVLDLYSRRIVGWSMQNTMTSQLVADALMMAVWRRGRGIRLVDNS